LYGSDDLIIPNTPPTIAVIPPQQTMIGNTITSGTNHFQFRANHPRGRGGDPPGGGIPDDGGIDPGVWVMSSSYHRLAQAQEE
jgi:hypothetical protein